MTHDIRSDIPKPAKRLKGKPSYPWGSIKVGESFLVSAKLSSMYGTCLRNQHKYSPRKFEAHEVEVDGQLQVRVWRTA